MHLLVDPDENYIYTKRKRRLLCQDNGSRELEASGCDSSSPSGTDTDTDTDLNNVRKVSFPVCGTSLSKSPLFVELDKHIRNSGKKLQSNENYSLPTGLRKAKSFLADEYLHNIQTNCGQNYFYFRAKCFHSFKEHDEPHNLRLAVSILSGDVEYAYCGPHCVAGRFL